MDLQTFFAQHPVAAMGLSGGVDSAYLLYAGLSFGAKISPYFVKTIFQPQFELDDALRICKQVGVELRVLTADILAVPRVAENGEQRCFFCKQQIFGTIATAAQEDGIPLLLDGTNADDDVSERPGMRALLMLSVQSPLKLCGIGKAEVRRCARAAGLFCYDKPAYACLATRVPTGTPITAESMQAVEQGEAALFSMGFSDFRLRVLGDAARLQLPAAQMAQAVQLHREICAALTPQLFSAILLDFTPRDAAEGDFA